MCVYTYMLCEAAWIGQLDTANLRTKILDFRGFDPSVILSLRGGVLMSTENLPEVLIQGVFVGIIQYGIV